MAYELIIIGKTRLPVNTPERNLPRGAGIDKVAYMNNLPCYGFIHSPCVYLIFKAPYRLVILRRFKTLRISPMGTLIPGVKTDVAGFAG